MSIKDTAANFVSELIHYESPLLSELDKLDEKINERVYQEAETYATYTHESFTAIDELEGEYGEHYENDGAEYSADQWLEAMRSYAFQLIRCALQDEASTAYQAIKDNLELFSDEVNRLGGDPDKARLSSDCEYGWAAHNYETAEGVMIWSDEKNSSNGCFNPELLEGESIAVSFQVGSGVWANTCFKPVFGVPGSVISGSMRPQDLIPAFLSVLRNLDAPEYTQLVSAPVSIPPAYAMDDEDSDWWQSEECSEFVNELIDTIEEYSPPEHYFGAHPDDGADYGFWLS